MSTRQTINILKAQVNSVKYDSISKLFIRKTFSLVRHFSTFEKSKFSKLSKNSNYFAYNKRFDTMISVRINEKTEKINLTLKCIITNNNEREFSLNRSLDEELGNTLQRLHSSYLKQLNTAIHKANKKFKTNGPNNVTAKFGNQAEAEESLPFKLLDLENKIVPPATKNRDAWKENYTFKFGDQTYNVTVNLPAIKKITLSKTLIAGMSALVKIEVERESNFEELNENSLFSWFASSETFLTSENEKFKLPHQGELEKIKWNLLEEGVNKKSLVLNNDCENRLIKGMCN